MRLTVTSLKDMLEVARGGRAIPNAYKKVKSVLDSIGTTNYRSSHTTLSKEKVDVEIAKPKVADRLTTIDIINIVCRTIITTGMQNLVVDE